MLTINYENMDKKGLKKVLDLFDKEGLPIAEVKADNKQTRESGFPIKQVTLTFESGQVLLLKVKSGSPTFYQAKLNAKVLAIRDYKQLDNEMKEIIKYVQDNEPNYKKQKEKADLKKKIAVPTIKAVNTTVAEQTTQLQATVESLKGQTELAKTEIATIAPVVAEKQTTLVGLNQQISEANALSDELTGKLDKAKQGIFESASQPLETGTKVKVLGRSKKGDSTFSGNSGTIIDSGKVVGMGLAYDVNIDGAVHKQIAPEMLVLESGDAVAATCPECGATMTECDGGMECPECGVKTDGDGVILEAAAKLALPGYSKWDTFAGGTGAAEGKNSYGIRADGGVGPNGMVQFSVDPISNSSGRHQGYSLKSFGLPGEPSWRWISPTGMLSPNGNARLFSRPQEAVKVAQEVYEKYVVNKEAA